jgi:general secretion pathway protein I
LKRLGSKTGTTLLEVMVALAVASIALVSFVTLVITSMEIEDHARRLTEATLIAEDMLKEIERTGIPDLGTTEGPVKDDEHPGFTYRLSVAETPIQLVRQIDVEVFWEDGKRSMNLVSYLAKQ